LDWPNGTLELLQDYDNCDIQDKEGQKQPNKTTKAHHQGRLLFI
jgi:hypothetical protein